MIIVAGKCLATFIIILDAVNAYLKQILIINDKTRYVIKQKKLLHPQLVPHYNYINL